MTDSTPASGITVQRGIYEYMQAASGGCELLIRNPDDPRAAAEALNKFRTDLWESDLFAPLDGELEEEDGRFTPTTASEVTMTAEGPSFEFDAQDILYVFPEILPSIVAQIRLRLEEQGVRRAEIGWSAGAYGDPADPEQFHEFR